MAFSANFKTDPLRFEQLSDYEESNDEYDSDDSEYDPRRFSIQKETNSKVSRTLITKKSKPLEFVDGELIEEVGIEDVAPDFSVLDQNDEKDFPEMLSIIKAGKLKKLKVEQCKTYLRKNGLRLTGTKDVLIQRINDHLEILNEGGEKKYPEYSFVVNCKGDACTGDVVMFEQKVYEMYNIASRSSTEPSCGTRTVAGRIVKESYGASKQQHTFTIEVLWSKGEKPLPPLHPLLIKGRNLYRMKTMRQTWEDEEERRKALMEKHARGSLARTNREARVTDKEKRIVLKKNRCSSPQRLLERHVASQQCATKSRKEGFSDIPSQSNLSSSGTMLVNSVVNLSIDSRKVSVHQVQQTPFEDANPRKPLQHQQNRTTQTRKDPFIDHRMQPFQHQHMMYTLQNSYSNQPETKNDRSSSYNIHSNSSMVHNGTNYTSCDHSRVLMDRKNIYPEVNRLHEKERYKQQRCRYFGVGRCYYGENCKFSHEMTEDFCGQRKMELSSHVSK